jgi:hypothetical protein
MNFSTLSANFNTRLSEHISALFGHTSDDLQPGIYSKARPDTSLSRLDMHEGRDLLEVLSGHEFSPFGHVKKPVLFAKSVRTPVLAHPNTIHRK